MAIRLLAIGNDYRGTVNELPDCCLDATNVAAMFKPFCASSQLLLSKGRSQIRAATTKFLGLLTKGDLGILYYSGHGTTDIVDAKTSEAIVCNDMKLIYDFELRVDLNERANGVMLAMAADSCYSGGLTRGLGSRRAIPVASCIRHFADRPARMPKKPNSVFMACTAKETASSTGQGGAWTLAFMQAFGERKEKTTLPAIHKRIRKLLPSQEYQQHPAFVCDSSLQGRTLKSFVGK